MIEITKFKPSDRASAEIFNKRLEEIEKFINDVTEENQKLKEQLDNKVEKTDKTVYKKLQNVQGTDVDILEFAKNLKASGFFQLFYQNKNVPTTGNWDWAFANIFYYNETTISLEIRSIFPPHSVAKVSMVNGNWSAWSVV